MGEHDIEAKATLLNIDPAFDDLEDFEWDIHFCERKRLWVATLLNGYYLLNVRSKQFKEIN